MVRWRKFLQKASDDVDSYVVVEVPRKSEDYSMLLKIADCDRNVKLWFPWSNAEKAAISRKKIAILREALDRLEEGLNKLTSGSQ